MGIFDLCCVRDGPIERAGPFPFQLSPSGYSAGYPEALESSCGWAAPAPKSRELQPEGVGFNRRPFSAGPTS